MQVHNISFIVVLLDFKDFMPLAMFIHSLFLFLFKVKFSLLLILQLQGPFRFLLILVTLRNVTPL